MSQELVFILQAVNVPEDICHKARKDEIEELVSYLRVSGYTPGDVVMLNLGSTEPGADASSFPWLKTLTDGTPVGLEVKYAGNWINALPQLVTGSTNNVKIQTGAKAGLVLDGAEDTLKDYGEIAEFDTEYISPPIVLISYTGGTLFDNMGSAADKVDVFDHKVIPTATGFNFWATRGGNSALYTLDFDWVAIGIIDPTL